MYDRQIRSQVETSHKGKFLVLDIETGEYEIDVSEVAALQRARAKNPDAALYILRVGYPTVYRLLSSGCPMTGAEDSRGGSAYGF